MSDGDLDLEDRLEQLECVTQRGLEVLAERCGMDGEEFVRCLYRGDGIEQPKARVASKERDCPKCGREWSHHTGPYCHHCGEKKT